MWGHLFHTRFPISVGFMIASLQQDPAAQTRQHLFAYLSAEIEHLAALKALNPALREEEIAVLKTPRYGISSNRTAPATPRCSTLGCSTLSCAARAREKAI